MLHLEALDKRQDVSDVRGRVNIPIDFSVLNKERAF
jgi:hypothetical protein